MNPNLQLLGMAIAVILPIVLLVVGVAYVAHRQNKRNYPDGWPPDKRDSQ